MQKKVQFYAFLFAKYEKIHYLCMLFDFKQ